MGALCCTPKNGDVESDDNPTRYLTSEELVNALTQASQDKVGTKKEPKGTVSINIQVIETILLENLGDEPEPLEAAKRTSKGRKGTGFVSAQEVESAMERVSFRDANSSDPNQTAQNVNDVADPSRDRSKARKGTGFVTKEKLLEVLCDSDEEEGDGDEEEPEPKGKPDPVQDTITKDRCRGRKGTGFVSKSKLKKVLDVVGSEGNDDEA